MHTAGGRVSVQIDNRAYKARGEITLDPSSIEVEAGVNQDGTLYRTVKAKARTAQLTFDRFVDDSGRPLKWSDNIMLLSNITGTFIENDTNVTHLLTGGFFTGKPEHNTATGEVTGLGFAAEGYETLVG
jgi:hypothetical protein